jgi:2-polyprenyl-3-methyl-5-hydroxy-6-metoxy-1,4-benzoquinol methylase
MDLSRLIKLSCAPPLYEKGNAAMWDDDYISGQLLEAHLSQTTDAASRRNEAIHKTVQWVETLAGSGPKKILDLGCGPGLYCIPLARKGHKVTGVDISRKSLAWARQEAARQNLDIEYIHKNYLNLDFDRQYDLAMIIYCDFDVLVPDERTQVLKNIFRSLKPGGILLLDTLNLSAPEVMSREGKPWEHASKTWEVRNGGFWKSGPYLSLSEIFHYQKDRIFLQQHIILSESEPDTEEVYRFWTHYYDTTTLTQILTEQGFSSVKAYENILPDDGSGSGGMVTFYTAAK